MYKLFRSLLFLLDPEKTHHLVSRGLKLFCRFPGGRNILSTLYGVRNERLSVSKMGLTFPNPVGLAAGFDKDASMYRELSCLGFGFIEIGTVTPRPQPGNEKPRLFRIPAFKALINRMGFNNDGADAAYQRLRKTRNIIIGGNIGRNKVTPNEKAADDYIYCFRALFDVVDYFVVNVSSPNTAGLRELQEKGPLLELLNSLQRENALQKKPKPVLLKIAPDLTEEQLDEIISIVIETQLAGIIATNTTIDKSSVKSEKYGSEQGGLSGAPLKNRSTEVIRYLREKAGSEMVIIGVGGIFTGEDAIEKLKAGADLLQVYTGFIYEGPAIVKRICGKLSQNLSA